jgi:hypothetical protein
MKLILLFGMLIFPGTFIHGQNLIGYKGSEIQNYMTFNHKDLNPENVKNSSFTYLKYTDGSESQTLLFFLNKDSICNGIRLICDSRIRAQKIKEFNSTLKKNGDNRWIEKREGKDYFFEVKDDKYSCIITIKPED